MKSASPVGAVFGGLAVLLIGFGAGYYYLGGQDKTTPPAAPVGTDTPASPAETPVMPSTVRRPPADAGEYQAPGAPDISINETPVSTAKPVATPAAVSTTDSEASQTGLPIPTPDDSIPLPGSQPADPNATPVASGQNGPANAAVSAQDGVTDGSQSDVNNAPVGESGQDGADQSTPASGQPYDSIRAQTAPDTLYHVQAGAFQNQKNADILEDALQHKGYAAMTVHEITGGHDTYIVQVGAYSSALTADSVVGNLQHDGFPASVSRGQ